MAKGQFQRKRERHRRYHGCIQTGEKGPKNNVRNRRRQYHLEEGGSNVAGILVRRHLHRRQEQGHPQGGQGPMRLRWERSGEFKLCEKQAPLA